MDTSKDTNKHDLPADDEMWAEIGRKLRERREGRGWSIDDLAYLSRVGRSTISAIELGERYPRIDNLLRLAAAMGATVEELMPDGYRSRLSPLRILRGVLGTESDATSSPRSKRAASAASSKKRLRKRLSEERGTASVQVMSILAAPIMFPECPTGLQNSLLAEAA